MKDYIGIIKKIGVVLVICLALIIILCIWGSAGNKEAGSSDATEQTTEGEKIKEETEEDTSDSEEKETEENSSDSAEEENANVDIKELWDYEVFSSGVWLIKYLGNEKVVTVPETIEGVTVSHLYGDHFGDMETPSKGVFEGCETLEKVIIPDSVTFIGTNCFSGCTNLVDVKLPSNITFINRGVFFSCSSLEEIHIPDSVTSIGESAFQECKKLRKIELPEGITDISSSAFERCESLRYINIPSTMENIYDEAFKDCYGIQEIVIPEGVTYLGNNAFEYCISLQKVYIPTTLTSLRKEVFKGCRTLKRVYIPNTITEMDAQCFDACSSLKEIICLTDTLRITGATSKLFNGVSEELKVFCTEGSTTDSVLNSFNIIGVSLEYCQPIMVLDTEIQIDLNKTKEGNLLVQYNPYRKDYQSMTWTSDNTSVVTVEQNGMMTAVGYGEATITLTVTLASGVVEKVSVIIYVWPTE